MKRVGAWLVLLLLVVSIALLTKITFGWLFSLNATVSAAVFTALLALAGVWYAQWQSKSRDIAESHRETKVALYNDFFDIIEIFQDPVRLSAEDAEPSDEMRRRFTKLNRDLVLWASPEVIKTWLAFKTVSASHGNVLAAIDQVYRAIRKDLGHSNLRLNAGDLVKLGLSDPDELKL